MPKTVIEKCQSPSPDITVFSVSGTLGFHEKDTLVKLFSECKKRNLVRVILDIEGLTSMGGGCANIIREEASSGIISIGIAHANATVLKFLNDDRQNIVISDSVNEVASRLLDGEALPEDKAPGKQEGAQAPPETPAQAGSADLPTDGETDGHGAEPRPGEDLETLAEEPLSEQTADEQPDVVPGAAEAGSTNAGEGQPGPGVPVEPAASAETGKKPEKSAPGVVRKPEVKPPAAEKPAGDKDLLRADNNSPSTRDLRKRIIQYNTVFSLASDFYRINDRKSLLELFLLTTIAQVGVESAVFLEFNGGYFTPAAVKGLEADELRGLAIPADQMNLEEWKQSRAMITVGTDHLSDEVRAPLLSIGCSYVAPFIARGEFRGILAMGKSVRPKLDEATVEFLKILINQAAIAYESTQRFEEEKKRTLGLVQTLISLIEENTLARGNTNLISNYTHQLAVKVHYPEEHLRDLIYGTVLRDIGMIKVSDLIVRSPRELMPEEWEIIKRHPTDGAKMLSKMGFSEHVVNVVEAHHERFNGEGYPNGIQGKQISMGARIVSVVESYAAMLQDRPTRPALTYEEALNTLRENWGNRYDPDVVVAFSEIVEDELRTGGTLHKTDFELSKI